MLYFHTVTYTNWILETILLQNTPGNLVTVNLPGAYLDNSLSINIQEFYINTTRSPGNGFTAWGISKFGFGVDTVTYSPSAGQVTFRPYLSLTEIPGKDIEPNTSMLTINIIAQQA